MRVPSILIKFSQHEMEKNCSAVTAPNIFLFIYFSLSHLTNVRGNKLNWNRSFWGVRLPLVTGLGYILHI